MLIFKKKYRIFPGCSLGNPVIIISCNICIFLVGKYIFQIGIISRQSGNIAPGIINYRIFR